jgi:hypothetical protein
VRFLPVCVGCFLLGSFCCYIYLTKTRFLWTLDINKTMYYPGIVYLHCSINEDLEGRDSLVFRYWVPNLPNTSYLSRFIIYGLVLSRAINHPWNEFCQLFLFIVTCFTDYCIKVINFESFCYQASKKAGNFPYNSVRMVFRTLILKWISNFHCSPKRWWFWHLYFRLVKNILLKRKKKLVFDQNFHML